MHIEVLKPHVYILMHILNFLRQDESWVSDPPWVPDTEGRGFCPWGMHNMIAQWVYEACTCIQWSKVMCSHTWDMHGTMIKLSVRYLQTAVRLSIVSSQVECWAMHACSVKMDSSRRGRGSSTTIAQTPTPKEWDVNVNSQDHLHTSVYSEVRYIRCYYIIMLEQLIVTCKESCVQSCRSTCMRRWSILLRLAATAPRVRSARDWQTVVEAYIYILSTGVIRTHE